MPYVEGFGTYPFGEEWLFDAVIRSYLPVLEVARDLTLTVTPVLADQLEDEGARRRLREFLVEWRIGAAEADLDDVAARVPAGLRGRAGPLQAGARAARRRRRRSRWRRSSAPRPRGGWRSPPPRPPTRCCRCWRPAPGLRLQLDAGIRSHRRRFGWDGGFWLPECAYAPGLEWRLAEHGVGWFCVDQSAHEEPLAALAPVRDRGGADGAADRLGGGRLALVARRLPLRPRPRPVRRQIAARDPALEGRRRRLRPGRRRPPRRGARPASSSPRSRPGCATSRAERGRRGLVVFAIDTELLGHWWSEGPIWLAAVLEGAAAAGVRLRRRSRTRSPSTSRSSARCGPPPGARRRTSAPGTRPRSPTSPGARGGWSCACCGRSAAACAATPPPRAARELLAAAGERLGLPRQARAGRRLRLPARHRSRAGRCSRP